MRIIRVWEGIDTIDGQMSRCIEDSSEIAFTEVDLKDPKRNAELFDVYMKSPEGVDYIDKRMPDRKLLGALMDGVWETAQ